MEIIKEFFEGHKGEEYMEVSEAGAEIQIALEKQENEIRNNIVNLFAQTKPFKVGEDYDFYKKIMEIIDELNK